MRAVPHRSPALAAACVAALLASACGDGPAQAGGGEVVYDCHGASGTAQELTEGPSLLAFLDHPGAATFRAESAGGPADWVIVEAPEDRLVGVRELDEPERLDDQLRTHERLEVSRVDASSLPDSDEDTWMLTSAGPCALEAQLGDLGSAHLALAPDADPRPDERELRLHATETACASGRTAEGRVEVVDLELTDDEVRLTVGVQPADGDQSCPSNPPTPLTVELPEPLGDRAVVDASVLPPRELHPG